VRSLATACAILLFSATSFARIGVVRTLTGQTVRGHVRITPNRVVVVNAELGIILGVDRTNLAGISFPPDRPAVSSDESLNESLPESWRETDIGLTRIAGSTRHEKGTFTVRGAGQSIDGESDAFHYVYQTVKGDTEIVAEVISIQYTHPAAKAGLMMRENLGEYSRHVTVALTAMRGGAVNVRTNEHSQTETLPLRGLFAPHWLKLRRRGQEFTAFISPNGRAWSVVGKIPIAMNDDFYVGLAVNSARDGVLNWTTFSKVRTAPKLVNVDYTPEVELTSGSIVTGRPTLADESEVLFTGPPKLVHVPMPRVARIAFQPLTGDVGWKTRISRPGVWVTTGDFFDGDFRNLDGQKLTISSVLYGLRTFDLEDEVLALVVAPRRAHRPQFEILTTDGSILLATGLALGDGEVRLQEPALGEVRLPAFAIEELRRR